MLSPSSRLGDDLYLLYLSLLAWFMLPFYGVLFNEVMPSEFSNYDAAFDVAVIGVCVFGVWSGVRGGPLMLNRAAILHELGSPLSKRRLLLPWLLRQATAWAIAAAVVATIALALADQDAFGYPTAITASLAALLATLTASFAGTTCMVATHGDETTRTALVTAASTAIAIVVVAKAVGVTFVSGTGLLVLLLACAVVAASAVVALESAPVEPLWHRAAAIDSMRSSLQQVDVQRVLLDLRNVAERPPYAVRSSLARQWMPIPLWRYLAAVQHTIGWHVARLAIFTGAIGLMFWRSDPSQGVVALAMAGIALLLGLELSGPIAATADQLSFLVHYRTRSSRLLIGQVLTALAVAVALLALVSLYRIGTSPRTVAGVLLIAGIGAMGASMQARLGSPDVAAILAKYGVVNLSKILWARAFAGPMVVLVTTAAVFHQFFRPEPLSPWLYAVIALGFAGSLATSARPLEKMVQRSRESR